MSRITNPYERRHIAHLAQYAKQIDAIYRTAVQEAAAIAAIISDFESSRVFSFNDYPITHQRVQSLLSRLNKSTETAIVNGINAEWTLANNKNNELSQLVFGYNVGRLTPAQYRRYFSTNDNARQAFLQRKEQGLNLSERVWQYTNAFRREIELGLDIGLRNGLSADEMSRELRQYLKYPDKLFRRVRDKHGNLVLSKRAAEFHPGQGVYRSSYKNARRLAITETNIAYRTADYERYQQLDFVVGIEIRLSNNHTCNGQPLYDICDELCGRYPKDFKFTGWHPHCRCHVVSILKTEEELMKENEAILAGKEPTEESVNRVADVPQKFRDWVKNNADRIKNARSIPYFMQDNGTIEKGVFTLKEFNVSTMSDATKPIIIPSELRKGSLYLGDLEEFDEDFFRLIDPNKPIKLTIENANNGSYSSFAGDEVVISNQDRYNASPYFRKSVIYHEYGHCIDAQRSLWKDKTLIDLRMKQKNELLEIEERKVRDFVFNYQTGKTEITIIGTKQMSLAEYINQELKILESIPFFLSKRDIDRLIADFGLQTQSDLSECVLKTADTLKSLLINYGWGHDRSYFLKPRMSETEYLAHAFENTFAGNPVFKKYMPTIFSEMVAYIKHLKPLQ